MLPIYGWTPLYSEKPQNSTMSIMRLLWLLERINGWFGNNMGLRRDMLSRWSIFIMAVAVDSVTVSDTRERCDTVPCGVLVLSDSCKTNYKVNSPPSLSTTLLSTSWTQWFKLVCTWGTIRDRKRGWFSPLRSRVQEQCYVATTFVWYRNIQGV